ncbi:MAG TPA: S1 RNA-binding domain-containing protein [Solirubrobacterales bacterium]|nr:S1 RNA-binding domain-containing protein [Solirubrobacterales bacterium]
MSATETMTPAPSATPVEGSNGLLLQIDGKIVPNYAATMVSFEEGDVVKGKVVRIDKDEVLVDIGYKAEGVIPSNELSIRKSVDPGEEVELGEEIDALVLTKEDSEGRLILSKKRARFEKAWRKIEVAADSGEPVEGSVIEVVKGGLILDLGVRGFLPASLVDIRRVHNLDEFMSQTLECKVIELNRSRNNVVLSRRAVLEEERKEVREQILGRLEPGQVVEGKISNIVDFGAFVDLEGIDGLIHISELADHHVENPSEVVEPGSKLNVKILEIDEERRRLSLSIKRVEGQNMAMAGLGEQIAQAEGAVAEADGEGQGLEAAGPVSDSGLSLPGESSESSPPAEEASEEQPSEGAEVEEAPVAEVSEEAPVAENGSGDEAEHQEGESVQERPDSPDDVDEASGDESSSDDAETGESEQS